MLSYPASTGEKGSPDDETRQDTKELTMNMKTMTRVSAFAMALAAATAFANPKGWTDDFEAAKAQAAKEGKLLLVDFSGSDWCCWCKKLDKEVFSKPEFVEKASKDFVLVMIDKPRNQSKLSSTAKRQNPKLCEKYNIKGFPTVLMMDAEGKVLGKTGYLEGGPDKYLKNLSIMKKKAKKKAKAEKDTASVGEKTSTPAGWTDDFEAAKAQATKEGKLLLVDFSGSDWCGACKKLDKEVFSNPEFMKAALTEYVFVMIDSPDDKSLLSEKAKEQNPKLCEKYNIHAFPTVLMMDADGNVLGRTYFPLGDPEKQLRFLAGQKNAATDKIEFFKSISGLRKGDPARVAKLEKFLDDLAEDQFDYHGALVQELLDADNDKYAKKYPKYAYVKPLERKLTAGMKAIQGRYNGKKASKSVMKEIDDSVKGLLADLKNEAEEIKAKVPAVSEEIDEFVQKLDRITPRVRQSNGKPGNKKSKKSGGKKDK